MIQGSHSKIGVAFLVKLNIFIYINLNSRLNA